MSLGRRLGMVIKLAILYFFFYLTATKLNGNESYCYKIEALAPSTLPDSGVTSTLTLGSPLQQWLKFAEPVLQIRQEAFLISSAGPRPWDKRGPRALDKEGPLEKEGGQSPKKVWSKNKGWGRAPPAPALDPPQI